MPKAFWVTAALSLGVYVALVGERWRYRRALDRIPVRVHVNGSRGKSSVTRLVAAALRAEGLRTVAKTTGTSARLILPDGSERAVPRDGPPNIRELIRTIRTAARMGAEAIVFECMAVDPDLQRVAETEIVRPTLTIVTNARLDHTDVQGTDERDIARAFAVRPGGTLLTADPVVLEMQGLRARWSGGAAHLARWQPDDVDGLRSMSYLEHPENVAVAIEAARLLGVPRDVALRGIEGAPPDPGMAAVIDVPDDSGTWTLVNLFAANDPDSTFRALATVEATFGEMERPLFLFVSRPDRTARSAQFAEALAHHHDRFSKVVVWGARTRAFVRRAVRHGLHAEAVVDAGDGPPQELTRVLVSNLGPSRTVVGMGNIVGPAHRWLESVAQAMETAPHSEVMA